MPHGPDIARVASLVGEPARANMLTALMSGQALTAGELAREAGVTPQSASAHLARLEEAGLLIRHAQGRHRYYALAGYEVGQMLEGLIEYAAGRGLTRARPGPRDPAMREARVCYDHLAGALGVVMLDGLAARGFVIDADGSLALASRGARFLEEFSIDVGALRRARRPVCRACLDWSVRRPHLGGGLGAALLARILDLGWAHREEGTRILRFTRPGRETFHDLFGPTDTPETDGAEHPYSIAPSMARAMT